MAMTTMNIRMSDEEKSLIFEYAAAIGVSASQFVRCCALERIESGNFDVEAFKKATEEYDSNPVGYSSDEILREFGLR